MLLVGCTTARRPAPAPPHIAAAPDAYARPCTEFTPPHPPAPSTQAIADPGRVPGRRGLSFRRRITDQSAVALSAGSGPMKEAPDLRVILGLVYLF
jgi:hypothetical protein